MLLAVRIAHWDDCEDGIKYLANKSFWFFLMQKTFFYHFLSSFLFGVSSCNKLLTCAIRISILMMLQCFNRKIVPLSFLFSLFYLFCINRLHAELAFNFKQKFCRLGIFFCNSLPTSFFRLQFYSFAGFSFDRT